MKEKYITITGMNHYYGLRPFSVGKKIKCIKDKNNPYDSEAIKVVMKEIGTVGYIANSPYTTATGTMSAGRIYEKVKKKFGVEPKKLLSHFLEYNMQISLDRVYVIYLGIVNIILDKYRNLSKEISLELSFHQMILIRMITEIMKIKVPIKCR